MSSNKDRTKITSPSPQWIEITIKYPNECLECKKDIIVGERQLWCKGRGVKHIKCSTNSCHPNKDDFSNSLKETVPINCPDKPLYDKKIYSFKEVRELNYCQFCGKLLTEGGDSFINCERKSCSKCFKV